MRLVLFLAVALPACAHDWLIVPGKRVGPVTAASTVADLRAAFGAAYVTPSEIQIGKSATAPGIQIYQGRPGEALAIVWPRKEQGLWWPLLVIPCYRTPGAECRWRTAEGVRPGLSLAEIERLNGKPFLLFPSSEQETWTDPWWDEGTLTSQLGEDIELSFDTPEYAIYAAGAYVPSNQKPLIDQPRKIDRMFVYLLSGRRTGPVNDWTIVPGERFGPIPRNAAAEPLRETFGATQVHHVLADADEGLGNIPGISVFSSEPNRQVLLRRDGNIVCGGTDSYHQGFKNCAWHIAGGIPFTAPLDRWERLNGKPFVFNGCCFDLGGIIISWEEGRMAKALHGARVVVGCEGDSPANMVGDVSLRSDDPDVRKRKCSAEAIDF